MPRELSTDERALWDRVTADWRGEAPLAVAKPLAPAAKPAAPEPAMRSKQSRTDTLDASWDRRLKDGTVTPDRVVDLHGLTLANAHARAVDAIASAARNGDRLVVIVTGKPPPKGSSRLDAPLRGIIRALLRDWLAASPVADAVAAIRPAHLRHGGAGALYIVLRRARQ